MLPLQLILREGERHPHPVPVIGRRVDEQRIIVPGAGGAWHEGHRRQGNGHE
jgi:hypothetical protein